MSVLSAAASLASAWLAAVCSSTMAAFFCVPWSMEFTAALISLRPVDCSRAERTMAATF